MQNTRSRDREGGERLSQAWGPPQMIVTSLNSLLQRGRVMHAASFYLWTFTALFNIIFLDVATWLAHIKQIHIHWCWLLIHTFYLYAHTHMVYVIGVQNSREFYVVFMTASIVLFLKKLNHQRTYLIFCLVSEKKKLKQGNDVKLFRVSM